MVFVSEKVKTILQEKETDSKCCLNGHFFILYGSENIVGKGDNAGYEHFSLSNNVFKSPFFFGVVKKSGLCDKRIEARIDV